MSLSCHIYCHYEERKKSSESFKFCHHNTPEPSYKNHEYNITLYADWNRNIWCFLYRVMKVFPSVLFVSHLWNLMITERGSWSSMTVKLNTLFSVGADARIMAVISFISNFLICFYRTNIMRHPLSRKRLKIVRIICWWFLIIHARIHCPDGRNGSIPFVVRLMHIWNRF